MNKPWIRRKRFNRAPDKGFHRRENDVTSLTCSKTGVIGRETRVLPRKVKEISTEINLLKSLSVP